MDNSLKIHAYICSTSSNATDLLLKFTLSKDGPCEILEYLMSFNHTNVSYLIPAVSFKDRAGGSHGECRGLVSGLKEK
ncbi:hypothetical protein SDJN03_03284, partial [Cucurbita argyrosperma subsp. sororia]